VGKGKKEPMLANGKAVAFVPSADLGRAQRFYVDVLGLPKRSGDDFGLVVEAGGVTIRIARAGDFEPQPFTVLGFDVEDVEATARELASKGIALERYPGMSQSPGGIWTAPGGARIGWFKDPDGNVISITQHQG
jgi:predicted enzyme related to lactoylglutathione lyase